MKEVFILIEGVSFDIQIIDVYQKEADAFTHYSQIKNSKKPAKGGREILPQYRIEKWEVK